MRTRLALLAIFLLWCIPTKAQDFVQSYNFVNTGTNGPTTSFANSGVTSFFISWSPQVSLSACSIQVDSSSDGSSWGSGDLIASTSCTTASSSATASLGSGKNFVRIHVTALTGNGGLNVTLKGWGGGGGGGTTFPSGSTPNTNEVFAADPAFGVKADAQFVCDATTTNTTNVVTQGASDPSFLTFAKPGMIVWVSRAACNSNSTSPSATAIAQTTILSVDSATQIHTTANANFSCVANCILAYGDDDTPALQAWYNSVTAGFACKDGVMPAGKMIVQAAINNPATICGSQTNTASTGAGYMIRGAGPNSTWLLPSPNFDGTNCVGGGAQACFFGDGNGQHLRDFTIFGSGFDLGTLPSTNYYILNVGNAGTAGAAVTVRNVSVWQWAAGVSKNGTALNFSANGNGVVDGFTCYLVQACIFLQANVINGAPQSLNSITNSQLQGRNTPITINTSSTVDVPVQLSHNLIGQLFSNGGLNISTTHIQLRSVNNSYGNIAAANVNLIINHTGSTINSVNDSIICNTTTVACVSNSGNMSLSNATISTGSTTAAAVSNASGAVMEYENSTIAAASSTALSNAGTVFDDGYNTLTGTTRYSGAGVYIGEANSSNITPVIAAKTVLSAGWGTTAAVTALSGGNAPIQFTVTNSGTGQGASPTITYTFPTPYPVAPFSCSALQTGGTNATGTFTSSALSATGVTFTFSLTPTAASTEIVQVTCVTP